MGVGLVTTRQWGSPPGSQSASEFPPGNSRCQDTSFSVVILFFILSA